MEMEKFVVNVDCQKWANVLKLYKEGMKIKIDKMKIEKGKELNTLDSWYVMYFSVYFDL